MSDSTIDDALRLLEIGKGSPDRLKLIIETFEKRSLIPLQDRKYVEALVQQYLTPRHRIKIKKIEPIKKEPTMTPRTLKSTKPEFSFEKNANTSDDEIDLEKPELSNPTQPIYSALPSLNHTGPLSLYLLLRFLVCICEDWTAWKYSWKIVFCSTAPGTLNMSVKPTGSDDVKKCMSQERCPLRPASCLGSPNATASAPIFRISSNRSDCSFTSR